MGAFKKAWMSKVRQQNGQSNVRQQNGHTKVRLQNDQKKKTKEINNSNTTVKTKYGTKKTGNTFIKTKNCFTLDRFRL